MSWLVFFFFHPATVTHRVPNRIKRVKRKHRQWPGLGGHADLLPSLFLLEGTAGHCPLPFLLRFAWTWCSHLAVKPHPDPNQHLTKSGPVIACFWPQAASWNPPERFLGNHRGAVNAFHLPCSLLHLLIKAFCFERGDRPPHLVLSCFLVKFTGIEGRCVFNSSSECCYSSFANCALQSKVYLAWQWTRNSDNAEKFWLKVRTSSIKQSNMRKYARVYRRKYLQYYFTK